MQLVALVGIKHRFEGRILEWYVASQLLLWGLILLLPENTFAGSEDFIAFQVNEDTLAWFMLALGVVRIAALIINGTLPGVTPLVRLSGAFIGAGVWFYISLEFAGSGFVGTWIAAWPMAFIAEFINIYRSAQHARIGWAKAQGQRL